MGLLDKREAFKPNEYDVFYKMGKLIVKTHWHDEELDFKTDKYQFDNLLTDNERNIIGTILKTFAQTETVVMDDFWGYIHNFIPKPEFKVLCYTFAENECRHAEAYDRLNQELGLTNYSTFLEDGIARERLDNLTKIKVEHDGKPDIKDLARTLAVFGGLVENVCLFSQFAIMLSFSQRGLLADIGNVIAWSQKDEALHANAAMTTFNILMDEYPQLVNRDDVKDDILLAVSTVFDIESNLISQIFENGDLPNISKESVVEFMKYRINDSMKKMGYESILEVDATKMVQLEWFIAEMNSLEMTDFFWSRPVEYTNGVTTYSSSNLF